MWISSFPNTAFCRLSLPHWMFLTPWPKANWLYMGLFLGSVFWEQAFVFIFPKELGEMSEIFEESHLCLLTPSKDMAMKEWAVSLPIVPGDGYWWYCVLTSEIKEKHLGECGLFGKHRGILSQADLDDADYMATSGLSWAGDLGTLFVKSFRRSLNKWEEGRQEWFSFLGRRGGGLLFPAFGFLLLCQCVACLCGPLAIPCWKLS